MAGRIPEKFIDELLIRADIVEVIDARVPLKKAGKDYKACCPFHEEKTPSFTVSQNKQFYHCFGCGAHGTAVGFLMEYERLSFPEAVEELAAIVGLTVPREGGGQVSGSSAKAEGLEDLYAVVERADKYFRTQLREHPAASEAIDYLKARGLTGEIAARFGMGYAPDSWDGLKQALGTDEKACQQLEQVGLLVKKDSGGYYDRFRYRVMFPIHDYRGRVVGFGGRVLGEGEPDAQGRASAAGDRKSGAAKYLNSPETPLFHKGRELYGLYRAREAIRREQRVLVVEGYMDVVALAQFGVDYAVATLGTATTRDHLERVFRYTPEVVFSFDGDRAGREAAWRALEQALPVMVDGRQISFLFVPEGDDPDSLIRREGQEGFEKRLKQANPLPEYLIAELGKQVDLTRLDGRARLLELAKPHLNRMPDGLLKDMLLDQFAEKSGIGLEKLNKSLKSGGKTPTKRTRIGSGSDIRTREKPSVVAQAMIWLLQYPKLAQGVGDLEQISSLDRPGMPLLVRLLHLLQDEPELTPAAVIERFRGEEHHRHLQKLMVWEHTLSEQDVEQEFAGSIRQFRKESVLTRKQELERKPLKQWDQRDRLEHQQLTKQMSELEQTTESEQT